MDYPTLKLIHILSSTLLFGTGIGSAFHVFHAHRRGDLHARCQALRHVVIADWLFTTPAIVVQLLSGVALVNRLGLSFSAPWLAGSLALFVIAGACWIPVVLIQIRMRALAEHALASNTPLPARYRTLERLWTALGAIAFPAVLGVFYLMVFKPQ